MNIYVSNLGFNIQDDDLKNLFTEYGAVSSAKVIMDKETGRSRGFGFVEMANDAEAQKAMKELDGKMSDGRALKVSEARAKKSNGYSGGGGGGRY
ncbi:MAG TPA: RNA-binding protein [Puia sp.]|jgi:RNA recognition motif-containing protein